MSEKTFIFIKPDGVERGLVGEVLQRFEKRQIKIKALKLLTLTEALVDAHYVEHISKPFFPKSDLPKLILPKSFFPN